MSTASTSTRIVSQSTRAASRNPNVLMKFTTSVAETRRLRWHVGAVVPFGFYTNAETMMPGFSTSSVAPHLRVNAQRRPGEGSGDVVVDDVDAGLSAGAEFTPGCSCHEAVVVVLRHRVGGRRSARRREP